MWAMIAQMGVSMLSQVGQASAQITAQRQQWEMQEKLRKAQNARIIRAGFDATNVVNDNKIRTATASQGVARAIQQEGMIAYGQLEAAAGSAGVQGKSVDRVLSSVQRQEATAEMKRQNELKSTLSAYDAQMQNIWASASLQVDPYQMPKPSSVGPLANLGLGLMGNMAQTQASYSSTTGSSGSFLGGMFSKGGVSGWGAKTGGTTTATEMPVSQEGFQPWGG